jgi:hypothetical protein
MTTYCGLQGSSPCDKTLPVASGIEFVDDNLKSPSGKLKGGFFVTKRRSVCFKRQIVMA